MLWCWASSSSRNFRGSHGLWIWDLRFYNVDLDNGFDVVDLGVVIV